MHCCYRYHLTLLSYMYIMPNINNNDKIVICEKMRPIPDGPSNVSLILTKVENESVSAKFATDCNPDCSYTWTPPGDTNDGQLYIDRIHRSQAGDYTCEAGNEVGSLTESS